MRANTPACMTWRRVSAAAFLSSDIYLISLPFLLLFFDFLNTVYSPFPVKTAQTVKLLKQRHKSEFLLLKMCICEDLLQVIDLSSQCFQAWLKLSLADLEPIGELNFLEFWGIWVLGLTLPSGWMTLAGGKAAGQLLSPFIFCSGLSPFSFSCGKSETASAAWRRKVPMGM